MYESQTYGTILARMLARIPDHIDKREGSIIYDACAPAAAEIAQMYIELGMVSNVISPDTATGYELTELSYQNSVFRKGAVKATRKGTFNIAVPIGSRFGAEKETYVVVELIPGPGFEYRVECEQPGINGNLYSGPIIPIDYIDGLTSAVLSDVIVPGAEEETDDQLRERLRLRISSPSQDGNVAQYREWAEAYEGIGAAKVFPLWAGGNTVKVAITDRAYQVADPSLVDAFQEYLDPGSSGLGNGAAPIGAKVTVTGGIKKDINVSGDVVLSQGYTEPEGVAEAIVAYLASVTYAKDSVSYTRLAVTILDTPSIADLSNFTVNGGIVDVELVGEDIPTLNSINLAVIG